MNEFIDWETLPLRKSTGKEKVRCPKCDSVRSDKKDKSLMVYHKDGIAKCFYCNALSFRDSIERKTEVEYKLPKQDWRNYTNLSDNLVKWLETERNISQSTAIALGWSEEKHYQPQLGKEVNNLVFNFLEGETLVNKKYRSGNKKFTQSAGTKSIFYNINSAIGKEEVWITEGEFDVAALYEVGIKNAISVPNGANDNDEYWRTSETYLNEIKRFIIAVDKDEKGNILKEKIAQRLGRWRCQYVEWDGKDANDDLKSGVLKESIKKLKRFPVSGTFRVSDLYDDIIDLYDNGLPDTIYPKDRCFGNLKNIYTVMRGQLNVGTGMPSHGKSNFTDWYVLNLVKDYDLKASWFSPEHSPMSLYHTNLAEKVIGKNFWGKANGYQVDRVSKLELEKYKDWADERIYLTDCVGGEFPTWDWLFEKFKEQMYSFGIDIFVIDAFNKVLLPSGNKIEQINIVLTKLTSFAQSNNVMVFLVAHPTKMQKNEKGIYAVPTLYDVSGSADFRNMTHNGYTIYRYFEDVELGHEDETEFFNMKTKFNFQGKIGESIKFKYCHQNGRFYANENEPLYSFWDDDIKEEIPTATPQQAFEINPDEVPF